MFLHPVKKLISERISRFSKMYYHTSGPYIQRTSLSDHVSSGRHLVLLTETRLKVTDER
jgi:hypothetical protein